MLLIHYYNISHFQINDHLYSEMSRFIYAETILYLLDTINMLFYIWVLFSASQFHFNFNLVSGAQYVIHFVDNIAILIMRFHWIFGYTDDFDLLSSHVFRWAMTCSIFCIISAMCSLPFFILERCFATLFLKDYETNQRRHISYILAFLLNVIGVSGALLLQNKENTIFIVGGLIAFNGIALSLNVFLRYWNMRKYKECHTNISARLSRTGQYSLAKRFQISENIKSLHMLNVIILYMGFMNVVLVISVLLSSLDVSPERQALCSMFLDGSIFAYSLMLPQIMTCYCQKWRVQTNVFKEKMGCLKVGQTDVGPLRDTFGGDMKGSVTMNSYFNQLKDSWERA